MSEPDQKDLPVGWKPFAAFACGWALLFGADVVSWIRCALNSTLHSYTLLIPLVSAYLLREPRLRLAPRASAGWSAPALYGAGLACAALAIAGWGSLDFGGELDRGRLALAILALVAGLALRWGGAGSFARIFPLFFLFVAIPLTPGLEHALSVFLQRPSGWAAYQMIRLTGTPVVYDEPFLLLPGLTLEVAEECSGIRSTLVLLIASTLGAYLFLRRNLSRTLFVAIVVPLGILRNGFRITALGWLAVHVNPGVLTSPLHHRGGPIFFALSLVVLLLVMLLLWRWERRTIKGSMGSGKDDSK